MPVKIEQKNAFAAIANAIDELKKYYSIDFDGNRYDGEFDIVSAHFTLYLYFLCRKQRTFYYQMRDDMVESLMMLMIYVAHDATVFD